MVNLMIAFAASLALCCFLGLSWWRSHEALAVERARMANIQADADACGEAVEELHALAGKRKAEADKLRAEVAAKARSSEKWADYTLSLKPKYPNDACASAQELGDEWLRERSTR